MPDSLKHRLAFHFHLRFSSGSSNEESVDFQGVKLERYVLHTVQDDLVSFNIHVPQEGDYFIELFASLVVRKPKAIFDFRFVYLFLIVSVQGSRSESVRSKFQTEMCL